MSLTGNFNPPAADDTPNQTEAGKPAKAKRLAPFSLRLTEEERARLTEEAGGAPLGSYIKAKVLGDAPLRLRRTGIEIEDREALGKLLSLLGASRIANNLNQLAHLANVGALPIGEETEAELYAAFGDVRDMRGLLLEALGLKSDLERP